MVIQGELGDGHHQKVTLELTVEGVRISMMGKLRQKY